MKKLKEKKRSGKRAVKVIFTVFAILIAGALITAISAFMPVYLNSTNEFYVVHYGSPFRFIEQVTELIPSPDYFPMYFTPKYSNELFETTVDIPLAGFSLLINTAIVAAIYAVFFFIHRAYRKKHPRKLRLQKEKPIYKPVFSETKD